EGVDRVERGEVVAVEGEIAGAGNDGAEHERSGASANTSAAGTDLDPARGGEGDGAVGLDDSVVVEHEVSRVVGERRLSERGVIIELDIAAEDVGCARVSIAGDQAEKSRSGFRERAGAGEDIVRLTEQDDL